MDNLSVEMNSYRRSIGWTKLIQHLSMLTSHGGVTRVKSFTRLSQRNLADYFKIQWAYRKGYFCQKSRWWCVLKRNVHYLELGWFISAQFSPNCWTRKFVEIRVQEIPQKRSLRWLRRFPELLALAHFETARNLSSSEASDSHNRVPSESASNWRNNGSKVKILKLVLINSIHTICRSFLLVNTTRLHAVFRIDIDMLAWGR